VYSVSTAVGRPLHKPSGETYSARARPPTRSSTLHTSGVSNVDDGFLPNFDFASPNSLDADNSQIQIVRGNGYQSVDLMPQRSPLNEFLSLDGFLAFDDTILNQNQGSKAVLMFPYEKLGSQKQSWCLWMRRGVPLSAVTENTMVSSNSNYATVIQMERPLAQHNADLIIQSLRSFPAMMLRKETFPWYVHQQSQILMEPTNALPETLSKCMGIAQMFALRTLETAPFLWHTIKAEHRRLINEVRISYVLFSY
jgi:hypothetical protein